MRFVVRRLWATGGQGFGDSEVDFELDLNLEAGLEFDDDDDEMMITWKKGGICIIVIKCIEIIRIKIVILVLDLGLVIRIWLKSRRFLDG